MNIKTTGNVIGCMPVLVSIFALFSNYAGAKQSVVETQFLPPSNQETHQMKILDQSLTKDAKLLIRTPSKGPIRIASELEGVT
jgi:hypothetical protein